MGKLHELLAVERTTRNSAEAALRDVANKFQKPDQYFRGHIKTLNMLDEGLENDAIEAAAREEKPVTTTVAETLGYALRLWTRAEDVQYQKNVTNQKAVANLIFRGETVAETLPVDELMGLEFRLSELRKLLLQTPTLDASRKWVLDPDLGKHIFRTASPEVTSKTEKRETPVVLYEATEHHPAQVEKVSKDFVVGKFTTVRSAGVITSAQKADVLARMDELIQAAKEARMRANSITVEKVAIGDTISQLIMEPLLRTENLDTPET